jgi:hypothetical protein
MAGEQDLSSLNGFFKKQYHDQIEDLRPDHAILQEGGDNGLIKWVPSDKMNGELYSMPVLLRSNQGVTYIGEGGSVVQLKSPKNAITKEAQIKGSEMNVRGQIAYKVLSQAAEKGARAFAKASAWLVDDLAFVIHTRIEIAALYGQTGLATVESFANVSGNTHNVVFTDASFAPGMWILLEGATIQLFNGTSERAAGVVGTVSTVTTATRTVKIAFSGTITPTANDVAFFEGANAGSGSFNEMVGLYKQLTDNSSTALFNLDRSAYALLQGNTFSSTGKLTKAKITDAAMKLIDKGAMGRLVCLVPTRAWGTLNTEDMALRRFNEATSKSRSGTKELVYDVNLAEIRVIAHPFVKSGEAFMFSADDVMWVGSAKPTFEIPGFDKEFFRLVDGYNAVELQNYADLAIYAMKPAQGGVFTGISYS